ncbi:MAG TPA: rubrerythrin family protein [Phycisphaerae bacterium]|nr:rubrerythrin family protein [Phycisphaerae bacterium]
MNAMTVANLRSAFGGESMAHMRYLVWADKAQADGFPNVGRLFRAISRAEQAHATGHFRAMRDEAGDALVAAGGGFGLGSTSGNLAGAIGGEVFEVEQMYPAYLTVAQAQAETGAIRSMEYALSAERIHAAMYTKAKEAVDAGNDVELDTVQICGVCGHTLEGDAPDTCPICGARKDKYVAFA